MKRYLLVLLMAFIPLLNTIVVLSQNDICTREAVASSYAQAVAVGTDLNQWYQTTYANSGCPEAILSFASSLAYTQLPANAPTTQPPQSEDSPPAGLKLPGPGTYLYTNGKLVRLSTPQSQDFSRVPQTSNVRPSVLFWSKDTSNNSLFAVNTIGYFKGGIGVTLGSVSGHILIASVTPNSPAYNAGLQYGDRIVSIDGIQIGDSTDQAFELLGGEIGTPVTITILRGTQSYTPTIIRGAINPQFSTWPYDAWDTTTIILKPDNPLPLGVYCVGDGCFRVVTVVTYVEATAEALDVPATATNTEVDINALCTTLKSIMHKSPISGGIRVSLDPVENWINNPDFNVFVYWNVDGRSVQLSPGTHMDFRSANTVFLESIHTLKNGQPRVYKCSK